MNYQQHPLSSAFPAMQADEYQTLCDSIGNIGVQNPITLFEGMVIDGWHRYTAAESQFVTCPTVEMGDIDPRDFVVAQNNSRRNLTASQRAIAVTSVYEWHVVGKPSNSAPVRNIAKTTKELAAIANVGTRTIEQTKVAQKAGFSEAIKAGAITVKEAASIATGAVAIPKRSPVAEPETEEPPDYTELDAAHDLISELQSDLVIARMGDIPEEEKSQAATFIAELRAEIKTLSATLKATCHSRDSLMEEATQMKRQMQMQRDEIKKLKSNK